MNTNSCHLKSSEKEDFNSLDILLDKPVDVEYDNCWKKSKSRQCVQVQSKFES